MACDAVMLKNGDDTGLEAAIGGRGGPGQRSAEQRKTQPGMATAHHPCAEFAAI
jgi:hypothetical protein